MTSLTGRAAVQTDISFQTRQKENLAHPMRTNRGKLAQGRFLGEFAAWKKIGYIWSAISFLPTFASAEVDWLNDFDVQPRRRRNRISQDVRLNSQVDAAAIASFMQARFFQTQFQTTQRRNLIRRSILLVPKPPKRRGQKAKTRKMDGHEYEMKVPTESYNPRGREWGIFGYIEGGIRMPIIAALEKLRKRLANETPARLSRS